MVLVVLMKSSTLDEKKNSCVNTYDCILIYFHAMLYFEKLGNFQFRHALFKDIEDLIITGKENSQRKRQNTC